MAVLASESPSSPIGATGILACRSVVLRRALAVWPPFGLQALVSHERAVGDLVGDDLHDARDLEVDVSGDLQGCDEGQDHALLPLDVDDLDLDFHTIPEDGQDLVALARVGQVIEGVVVAHEDPPLTPGASRTRDTTSPTVPEPARHCRQS